MKEDINKTIIMIKEKEISQEESMMTNTIMIGIIKNGTKAQEPFKILIIMIINIK
jgi:hypothetical protein